LAQTFHVEPNAYPSGLFLHSIDLYFAEKDENLPVTLQIRPTVGGYPHSSVIAPFSEVVKMPADINVNADDTSLKTTFTFSSPVYLEPGEYAIVLITNSDDYELYAATVGGSQSGSYDRITSSPYTGSLFYSQNESIAEPDYTTDLMFSINRCVFQSVNGTVTFRNSLTGPVSERKVDCDTFKINSNKFIPAGTNMTHTAQFTDDAAFDIALNENITKGAVISNKKINKDTDNFKVISALKYSSNSSISPVIDTKMLNITCIENSINEQTTDRINSEKLPSIKGHPSSARSRYITRRVTLPEGMSSTDLRVFVSVYKPTGAHVKVFMKYSNGITDINHASYMQLISEGPSFTSTSEFDFRDREYKLDEDDYDSIGLGNIKTFVVKIVFFGNDDEVPIVKDLRVVALD